MAQNAYLTLEGDSQGLIEGSVTTVGLEGKIEIIETKHFVHYALDAVSGAIQPSNKKHKPITIAKVVDKSSPLLLSGWITNENFSIWKLEYYRPDNTGATIQFYTIELENASIVSIRFEQPNTLDPQSMALPEMEQITFTYSKIIVTHEPTGNSAEEELTSIFS